MSFGEIRVLFLTRAETIEVLGVTIVMVLVLVVVLGGMKGKNRVGKKFIIYL